VKKARKLGQLKAVGPQSSWLLSHECFGWRGFRNRKQVGSFAGLTGTPFDSGETMREQGISKAGSGRVRTAMIELAWGWVRWQPASALTHWFLERYVRGGTSRSKRKGIVALARKLLVALWKYLEQDLVPEGAVLRA
jgi:transposase